MDAPSFVWLICIGIWTVVQLAPIAVTFYESLRQTGAIFAHPVGIGGFDLGNFSAAWVGPPGTGAGFATYLRNTAEIGVIAVALALGSGLLSAYGLSQSRGQLWAKVVYGAFILALAMPYEILIIPIFELLSHFVLLNSVIGLGLTYGALLVPFVVVVMRGFFDTFPVPILEAARVDGASELRTFLRMVLPLSRGSLVGVTIIAVVYVWGELELGIVALTLPSAKTIAVGMIAFQGQYSVNEGAIFAGLTMAILPVIGLYLLFQRQVNSGLTSGAIK
jgi:ABC-type glycerol-3-phosphate transport system permease component